MRVGSRGGEARGEVQTDCFELLDNWFQFLGLWVLGWKRGPRGSGDSVKSSPATEKATHASSIGDVHIAAKDGMHHRHGVVILC
jgi:hypothetical protein